MKLRISVLVLFALVLAAAPAAHAQIVVNPPGPGSTTGPLQQFPWSLPSGSLTNRAYSTAALTNAAGQVIGKVKTGSATRGTQLIQGLRLQATGLTPNAEYALVIDGKLVGTEHASATGVLRMAFISPTNGRAPLLPDSVSPITSARSVQLVLASTQQVVANGQLVAGQITKPR